MNRKIILLLASLIFAIMLCGSATAATQTNNTTSTNNTTVCAADPIINGTVTISEYGKVRPLSGAKITINSTSNRILATATTDENGYYSTSFYSTDTTFKVTAEYLGCPTITQNINVAQINGSDPNYYATANFQMVPRSATLTSTGRGSNVYVAKAGSYEFAGIINVSVNGTTYSAFCIDLYTPISIGDTLLVNGPLPGTSNSNFSSLIDWGKVNYIVTHYTPSTNTEAAAMQCAIWYFTSVQYGVYPGNDSSHPGYYQFMTNPSDGLLYYNDATVRNRAWQMINAATSVQYPYNISIDPEMVRLPNGQAVNIVATVTDIYGNPLSGVTVNFTKTAGTLNATSAVTDANGKVYVRLTSPGNDRSIVVTASVSGTYATLLYDDIDNPKQNLVAVNVLPYTISAYSILNYDATANVTLSQNVSKTVANVGDTITYVVKASNIGSITATGLMIQDIVPAGLSNVVVTPSVGTYYNGMWVIPSLNSGSNATLTITGVVTSSLAGLNTTNAATRIAQDQYNAENNSTSATFYTKKANVVLSQTVNSPVNVGNTVTYIVRATNNGPDAATNVVISNVLQSGLSGVTFTPSVGTYNSTTGIWTIPTLNNGANATLTITGTATSSMAGRNNTNVATQTGQTDYSDLYTSSSASVYTKKANVSITQTVNSPVNVGNLVSFIVTALNNGPDNATNLVISDLIPGGLTNVVVTPSVGSYNSTAGIWTIPSLANGFSAILNITGNAGSSMAGLNTTNNATRTGQTEYNELPSVSAATVYTKTADVTITNTANSSSLNVGQTGVFTVVVTNNGPDTVTNINISDLLPGFTGSVSLGSYNSTTGLWTIPSLAPGSNATLTLSGVLTSGMAGNNVTNHATETQTESPFTVTIPDATIHVKKANVVLSQTVNSPVNVGNTVTYTVTATNNGPDAATNVLISDVVPVSLGNVTVTPSIGTFSNGVWTIPTLANGQVVTLTITGNATPSMAGNNTTNTATQTGQTEYSDEYKTSSATVYTKMAEVQLSETSTTPVNVGDTVTYVVRVTNHGPDAATNTIIRDIIPSGLSNVTITPSVGTYVDGNWTIPIIANGETVTLTITGIATSTMAGKNTTNTATKIFETEYDPTTIGESTSADAYTKEANVVLSQIGSYKQNIVTFIVTATNNGPDNATEVNIKDLIPAGLTGVIVTPSLGTYNNITGIWYIPVLANGSSVTLNITGNATVQTTVYNNATKLNQTEFDPNTLNFVNASVYVPSVNIGVFVDPWYYLDVDKKYLDLYSLGNTPVFMWNVVNSNSRDDVTGVVVELIIPKGFEYVGSTCGEQGTITYRYDAVNQIGVLTWDIGYMPQSGNAMAYVTLRVNAVGNKTADLTLTSNLINLDQFDINRANDQNITLAIESPPSADIQVNQSYVKVGSQVTYTITVKNNGPSDASGVQVTDILPSGVTWVSDNSGGLYNHNVSGTGAGVWNIGNITNGETKTLIITVLVNPTTTGTIRNTAKRTSQVEKDSNYNNNGQSTYITISGTYTKTTNIGVFVDPWYYLQGNKKYLDLYSLGNTPVFMWNVVNSNSRDDVTGVVVELIIPKGFEYVGSTCGEQGTITYRYDAVNQIGVLTWDIGYMPQSGNAMAYVTLRVNAVGNKTADLTLTSNLIQGGEDDINHSNDQNITLAIESPPCADIQLNQTCITYTENSDQFITYTISVTNNGPSDASGVQITDILPTGLTWVSDNSGGLYNHNTTGTGAGIWNLGNMVSGETKTLIITVLVNPTTTGTIRNTAKRTSQVEKDSNFNNNGQSTYITISS